jgi:hypothetical protein
MDCVICCHDTKKCVCSLTLVGVVYDDYWVMVVGIMKMMMFKHCGW